MDVLTRRLTTLFVLCTLSVFGVWASGHRLRGAGRIIGGRLAMKRDFSFLVSIQLFRVYSWIQHCGGSIISPFYVLTACHCVVTHQDWDPPKLMAAKYLRIIAGVGNLSSSSGNAQLRKVATTAAHPKCGNRPYYLSFDVAVITLKSPLQFNSDVKPLKLFSRDKYTALAHLYAMASAGATCYSPGWGTTASEGYKPSSLLKVAKLKLLTGKQCRQFFCSHARRSCDMNFEDAKQVCAAGQDSTDCNGDSGGPLVCNGMIVGTVSWRWLCSFGWPHVFTNVDPILDMVNKYSPEGVLSELAETRRVLVSLKPQL